MSLVITVAYLMLFFGVVFRSAAKESRARREIREDEDQRLADARNRLGRF